MILNILDGYDTHHIVYQSCRRTRNSSKLVNNLLKTKRFYGGNKTNTIFGKFKWNRIFYIAKLFWKLFSAYMWNSQLHSAKLMVWRKFKRSSGSKKKASKKYDNGKHWNSRWKIKFNKYFKIFDVKCFFVSKFLEYNISITFYSVVTVINRNLIEMNQM